MRYARSQSPAPAELEAMNCIDRFGVQAVLGRALYRGEALKMMYAKSVYRAIKLFDQASDMGELMQTYPDAYKLAVRSLEIAYG